MAMEIEAPDAALVERERIVALLQMHADDIRSRGITRMALYCDR
jgi:hypothetical protein